MKKLLIVLLLSVFAVAAFGQQPARVSIASSQATVAPNTYVTLTVKASGAARTGLYIFDKTYRLLEPLSPSGGKFTVMVQQPTTYVAVSFYASGNMAAMDSVTVNVEAPQDDSSVMPSAPVATDAVVEINR